MNASSGWISMATIASSAEIGDDDTISTSTIFITIEADEECERTPLLGGQWRGESASLCSTINSPASLIRNYGGTNGGGISGYPKAAQSGNFKNFQSRRQRFGSFGSDGNSSITSYTSTYYYEAKTHLCDLRLFAIFFILITGFTIATYLLIADARQPATGFTLDLVTHDIWSKMAIPTTSALNHSNVANVLILHTAGESCVSSLDCSQVLSQMQKFYANLTSQPLLELPYNFLVADDGQTYEVRGWDRPAGLATLMPQNSSIVIGFLGNFTATSPSIIPLQSALSLIKESVRRKKLQQNYRIYGLRNTTAHDNDAEALFQKIIHWSHFEKIINIF